MNPFVKRLDFFLVPGGNDGPSGVLICSENYITYKNFGDQQDIRCPIPRRKVGSGAFCDSKLMHTAVIRPYRVSHIRFFDF